MQIDPSKQHYGERLIELRMGSSLVRGSQTFWILALTIGLPLLVITALMYQLVVHRGVSTGFDGIVHGFWKFLGKDSLRQFQFWILIIATIVLIGVQILQRFAYIRITNSGLEGYIPTLFPQGILGQSVGHWRILWDSIRSIHLIQPKQSMQKYKLSWDLRQYRLEIETDRGRIRLAPFTWILRDGPDHRLTYGELRRQKSLDAANIISRSPLVKILRSHRFELVTNPVSSDKAKASPVGYDLSKHRGLVMQLVLFFGAGLYALFDGLMTVPYKALESMPVGPFVVVAATGVMLAVVLGKGAPRREGSIVGVLMVAALTAAVYPAMLRWNAQTATPQEINYLAVSPGQFEATKPGYPRLDLRSLHIDAYWAQYPNGNAHPFVLLRGAGGFYQLDLDPLYKRTRDFYKTHSLKGRALKGQSDF